MRTQRARALIFFTCEPFAAESGTHRRQTTARKQHACSQSLARDDAPLVSPEFALRSRRAAPATGSSAAAASAARSTASFDSIQANVFEQVCEHCHSGANAPAGLRLDAANSYAMLVGVASVERSNVLRVAPGDPNNSYLIQKLEGTAGVGERMPAGLPALPQADINIIRQWITDGAQPGSSASGPIRVTSLSPTPGVDGASRCRALDHGRLQPRGQRSVRDDGDVHAAARRRRRPCSARPTTSRLRLRP